MSIIHKLSIVIDWLLCLCKKAEAISSTVELVNSVTSDFVNSFKSALYTFTSKCSIMELVPGVIGWGRPWWQTIHTMPALLVSSFPQVRYSRFKGACLKSFQVIGCFEPKLIEVQQSSNMICKGRLINISNNSSFRLKHPGVPDGSDSSHGTSYPLTENRTRPFAQATGRVAYLPCSGYYTMPPILATRRVVYYSRRSGVRLPLLCVQNMVTYRHHPNDTYVTLFAGVAVMQ